MCVFWMARRRPSSLRHSESARSWAERDALWVLMSRRPFVFACSRGFLEGSGSQPARKSSVARNWSSAARHFSVARGGSVDIVWSVEVGNCGSEGMGCRRLGLALLENDRRRVSIGDRGARYPSIVAVDWRSKRGRCGNNRVSGMRRPGGTVRRVRLRGPWCMDGQTGTQMPELR